MSENKNKITTENKEIHPEKLAIAFDKEALSSEKILSGSFTKTFISWDRICPALQLASGTMSPIKGVIVNKDGIELIL